MSRPHDVVWVLFLISDAMILLRKRVIMAWPISYMVLFCEIVELRFLSQKV